MLSIVRPTLPFSDGNSSRLSPSNPLRDKSVTWVTRSFLDYRIPVYAELDRLLDHRLTLIYSRKWTPERCQKKIEDVLGDRAIGLSGEKQIGKDGRAGFANRAFCLPWQPGLYRELKNTEPDLVLADGFFRWTPAGLWHRIRTKTPLVVLYEKTFHTERNAQWVRTFYRSRAMRWIDAMCCNGRLSAEYSAWLGMSEDRITKGHMVADTDDLQRRVSEVTEDQIRKLRMQHGIEGTCLLYIGRLIPLKGLRELLAAWKRVEEQNIAKTTLVLVGNGPEEESLRSFVEQHGLRQVRFVGWVDYDAIAEYYAMADCFVIPTLEDNWSLVVPEAMACGLPILCSNYNGCWPELVQSDENGWCFDPHSTDDTSAVINKALSQREQLTDMGRRSREIVANHSPATAAASIYDACRIAVSRH